LGLDIKHIYAAALIVRNLFIEVLYVLVLCVCFVDRCLSFFV